MADTKMLKVPTEMHQKLKGMAVAESRSLEEVTARVLKCGVAHDKPPKVAANGK